MSVGVPAELRRPICSFRWWQPRHSGRGRDVWALDDVTIAGAIYNALQLDFSESPARVGKAVDTHLGKFGAYCGRKNTLRFLLVYVILLLFYFWLLSVNFSVNILFIIVISFQSSLLSMLSFCEC